MDIEILHVSQGDKKRKIDTSDAAEREAAKLLIESLLRTGTAVFLERGKKTYRVKGYDAATDKLIVDAEVKGAPKQVTTKGRKAKVTAVPPVAGGCA